MISALEAHKSYHSHGWKQQPSSKTPLWKACSRGHVQVIGTLLAAGCDASIASKVLLLRRARVLAPIMCGGSEVFDLGCNPGGGAGTDPA